MRPPRPPTDPEPLDLDPAEELPEPLTKGEPGDATLPLPERGPGRLRRFTLRVLEGPEAGQLHTSKAQRVVVGTHPSADLRLSDPTVSRFHCELGVAGEQVRVTDLDSRNGTVVDGVRIQAAWLRTGQVLTLGRTRLRFETGTDEVDLPLSAAAAFGTLVGHSTAMRATFALLERAAATDATVLLEGETGTGKEAAAESLHRQSARREGPFVVVDCGAIPRELLESELFGHEKGAFTGAHQARTGAFEAAQGGTLFLDEVGELAPELQPKLLRALERREVKRVGSNRYLPVDVRLVAATHRNLRREVNSRQFRADLYYRLAVVEVRLPALRERLEDLPELVEHLLGQLGMQDRPEADLARGTEFLGALRRHGWPGNVRELRNHVERSLALQQAARLEADAGEADAGAEPVDLSQPYRRGREAVLRRWERRYLEGMLARSGGNVTAAAQAAGIDRVQFYRLLWRNGLR